MKKLWGDFLSSGNDRKKEGLTLFQVWIFNLPHVKYRMKQLHFFIVVFMLLNNRVLRVNNYASFSFIFTLYFKC